MTPELAAAVDDDDEDDDDDDDDDYYYYYLVPPWCDAPSFLDRLCTWMLSFLKCTRPWTSLGFGHGCSLFSNALDHGRH